jgi:protein-disulfide isomerase
MMATAGKRTNWFAIWVSVAVVAVVVVAGVAVVLINNAASDPGPAPEAAIVNSETGAISVGDGPDVVATYIDFMCPICNQFEGVYAETLNDLVADGSITLEYHPVAILDRASQGTEYSTRSANALYCVAVTSPEAVTPFVSAMYAQQPDEGTPGLTDDEIIAIAKDAGAGDIASCVTDREYGGFVTAQTKTLPRDAQGNAGTPTVTFNGERIDLTGDPQVDIIDRLS